MGSKEGAKYLLLRRKNLEKFWQSLSVQKYHLDDQLIKIEESDTQNVVFDALTIAESANSSMNK